VIHKHDYSNSKFDLKGNADMTYEDILQIEKQVQNRLKFLSAYKDIYGEKEALHGMLELCNELKKYILK
jgi:hypothetical protein